MYCNKCGKEVDNNARYCDNCGSELIEIASAENNRLHNISSPGYFSISGRVGRLNHFLKYLLPCIIICFIGGALVEISEVGAIIAILLFILAFVIGLVGNIKRIHDLNLSAWYILLNAIPLIGTIAGLAWIFLPGSKTENKYGYPDY